MTTTNDEQPIADKPTPPPGTVWHTPVGTLSARWDRQAGLIADPRRKHPLLAMVLSAMPGLGQIYVGYYQQGITLVVIAAALVTVSSRSWSFGLNEFEPMLMMFTIFTWLYSCVDAGRRASLYNQSLSGLRPMDLPEDQRKGHHELIIPPRKSGAAHLSAVPAWCCSESCCSSTRCSRCRWSGSRGGGRWRS